MSFVAGAKYKKPRWVPSLGRPILWAGGVEV